MPTLTFIRFSIFIQNWSDGHPPIPAVALKAHKMHEISHAHSLQLVSTCNSLVFIVFVVHFFASHGSTNIWNRWYWQCCQCWQALWQRPLSYSPHVRSAAMLASPLLLRFCTHCPVLWLSLHLLRYFLFPTRDCMLSLYVSLVFYHCFIYISNVLQAISHVMVTYECYIMLYASVGRAGCSK